MNSHSVASIFNLTGKVALITGSTRGIGRILAGGLAEAGATVVLNGRDPVVVEAIRQDLDSRFPGLVDGASFDVTNAPEIDRAIGDLEVRLGGVDILVNNAGLQHRSPLLEVAEEDWERVLRTDLTSAFLVARRVAPRMIARGAGKIINIASIQADLARPSIAPYAAAKGGLRNLTRAMAAEWAGHGIQTNAVAPGYFRTEMTRTLAEDPHFDAWVRGRTPAGRWGEVGDLVGPVVWLASAAADYVNGQTIFVDGGMSVVV